MALKKTYIHIYICIYIYVYIYTCITYIHIFINGCVWDEWFLFEWIGEPTEKSLWGSSFPADVPREFPKFSWRRYVELGWSLWPYRTVLWIYNTGLLDYILDSSSPIISILDMDYLLDYNQDNLKIIYWIIGLILVTFQKNQKCQML